MRKTLEKDVRKTLWEIRGKDVVGKTLCKVVFEKDVVRKTF